MNSKKLQCIKSIYSSPSIAHRLSTIKKADQILVIEAGRIEEQGTHETRIAPKGRHYDLYTSQAKI